MEKIVVDSSIVVKWFIEEEKSKEARQLLKKHEDELITLYAPDIIILEVLNALFFKAGFPKDQLIGTLNKLYNVELHLISIQQKLSQKTLGIVIREEITFYDGLFIALAQELDCYLITNDKKHHRKKMYKKIRYL